MAEGGSEESGPSFAELLAQQGTPKAFEVGQVVSGQVLQIGHDDVFVDVSGKGEGHIARSELLDDWKKRFVETGD
jgi:ribosomal protein S1